MFKLPMVIVYMIIAFNITAFTAVLLMDVLVINSPIVKIISCTLSVGAWAIAYIQRDKVVQLF